MMRVERAGGNVIDIRERLATRAFGEAERNLLDAIIAQSFWEREWGMPWVYGGPRQMGVTPGLLADATGFRRLVIERNAKQAGIEIFEGVMCDIAVAEHRGLKAQAVAVVDIPALLLRLKPHHAKEPSARDRLQRLRDLAKSVRRAIARLPRPAPP